MLQMSKIFQHLQHEPIKYNATICIFIYIGLYMIFVDFVNIYVYNLNMKSFTNITNLAELASTQWGMFTSAQAQAEGVSRVQLSRMVKDGRIETLTRGTYHFVAVPDSQNAGIKAAWLSLNPSKNAFERLKGNEYDFIAAGRTAAVLLGDTDLHEQPYCFVCSPGTRTARKDVKLLPWNTSQRTIEPIDGIPTSSPEQTVADLIHLREDPSLVGNFVSGMAARGHIFNEALLSNLLDSLAARNGYRKGNGAAFAKDIISQNAAAATMHRIEEQANEARRLMSTACTA